MSRTQRTPHDESPCRRPVRCRHFAWAGVVAAVIVASAPLASRAARATPPETSAPTTPTTPTTSTDSTASADAAAAGTSQPKVPDDVRGITVSCQTWGHEWARPAMRATLSELPEVGANWVTIHPYAHVRRETGEVLFRHDADLTHVTTPIRWAHEHGLRIMIKPHLSYWGEFAWRGEVGWPDAERWATFERTYRRFILAVATASREAGADLFVVGTELRRAEPREDYWRSLIADIRAIGDMPLTYAANWDDHESVSFWDALDLVGVQAYFPLSSRPDPSEDELRRAWRRHAADLAALSRRVGRPVLLTEIGYTDSPHAASRPWESWRGPSTTEVQARCLSAALSTAAATPEIVGAFVWKWFPTSRPIGPGDFTVQTPSFRRLLRETWLGGGDETGTAGPPARAGTR